MNTNEIISKIKWRKLGHYLESFLFDYMFYSEDWDFNELGIPHIISKLYMIDRDFFVGKDEDDAVKEALKKKIQEQGILFYQHYMDRYYLLLEEYLTLSESTALSIHSNKSMTNEELADTFLAWISAAKRLNPWLHSLNALDFHIIDKDIKSRLTDFIDFKNVGEVLRVLSYPSTPFFMSQERDNLLDIACTIQKQKEEVLLSSGNIEELKEKFPAISQRIIEHHERFRWLNSYLWLNYPADFSSLLKKLREILAQDCYELLEENKGKHRVRLSKINDMLHEIDNPKFKELVSVIRNLIHLKTYRIDVYSLACYKVLPLFDELCTRLQFSYDELIYLTHKEIVEALQGKQIDRQRIYERKQGYILFRNEGQTHIYAGRYLERLPKVTEAAEHMTDITGNIAYKGVVRGKAKIVKNASELHKVKKDDIIIAPMTDINYIPVLHLVKGIITDEGGILCHSAVVSREFEIPCITGTEVATQIFKDGDFIELDADNGKVKKLSQDNENKMKLIAKGLGVSQGKAQGKVKIIRDINDHHKFDEGNILVTRITDPTMIILMGKAAAIVCDIGGMTSHPSIVSREMGIPCIVSAKHIESESPITDVLKDDMNIYIDGESGEIHLLD